MNGPHPYLEHRAPIAFAHRGGAGAWPENTLPAFQHAVDLGYRYLETDVHASADGVLFAFHDDHLARMTGADARVGDLDACDIDKLLVEGTYSVPRFDELLSTWPLARINIDPKSDAAVLPLLDTLRRPGLLERVCVGSFSDRRIRRCRRELGAGLCTSMGRRESARLKAVSLGLASPEGLHSPCAQLPVAKLGRTIIDQRLVDAAHECAIDIHVWTVDEPDDMRMLLDLGVDGIMTDRPAVLRRTLIERSQWEIFK